MTTEIRRVPRNPTEAHFPEFLTSRVTDCYVNRVEKVWGGDHLLWGLSLPGDLLNREIVTALG